MIIINTANITELKIIIIFLDKNIELIVSSLNFECIVGKNVGL